MSDQILDLVGQPPGSLVYHFIILFAVEAAFAIVIGQWMRERSSGTFRLALAIFAIFCGRVVVLVASLAAWQGYLPRNVLLPPVERAVDTLTILSTAWAFITMNVPDIRRRNFGPDVIAAVLTGITVIAFAGTYYFWGFGTSSERLFNGLWIDMAWAIAQIDLAVVGLVWMLARGRSIYDPVLKSLILLILGAAAAAHLIWPVLGDVATAMRLGQIVAMPMLAAAAYRHVIEQLLHWDTFEPTPTAEPILLPVTIQPAPQEELAGEKEEVKAEEEPAPVPAEDTVKADADLEAAVEPKRAAVVLSTLEVVESLGGLLSSLEPTGIIQEATRVVATALRADICVIAIVDEEVQHAAILGGYDNITQAPLPQDMLNLADHPTIVNALGRLRQMRLTTPNNSRELRDLFNRLQITHEGPAYIQPLVNDDERIGVLIAASPYSTRLFSLEERNLLDRLGPLVTAALLNAEAYKKLQEEIDEADAQEAARSAMLADDLMAKTTELHQAERQIEEMKSYIRDLHRQLEEFPQQQTAAQDQIIRLTQEAERLRAAANRAAELEKEIEELHKRSAEYAVLAAERKEFSRQLEETRSSAHTEIAALKVRLTQAAATQQEISFLQETLAAKAREVVMLQTRLAEAQAVSEALREQVSGGLSSTKELGILQARVAAQATEINELKIQLVETQSVSLDENALRAQEEMDRIDREAMAHLEAQLADRTASIEALERQLAEKAEAIAALKSHMADVNASLRNLDAQFTHKTDEVAALQRSLSLTRKQARERIASLEAALEAGTGDPTAVDRAHVEAMEAELAEKSAAIRTLEEQLERTRQTTLELEQKLSATHQVVDDAISETQHLARHDEVIASIAQELRTPMSSIMGYTELLLRESVGILGPLQRKFLLRVKANTERMGSLLDDLIRISTMDTGQMQLEPEKVDVFYAVEEVIMKVANQYSEKGLILRLSTPEELPPITSDREALVEVVQHLLSNAALASPVEGEVVLTLSATRVELPYSNGDGVETDCLKITVEDTGEGIDPADHERVFLRKYRAENPLIEGLGDTGVGLSLARALVEAQGGQIWLESKKGEGTTFHVLLPLQPIVQGDAG